MMKCILKKNNLALTCRNWSVIAKDPYAKTEWLIVHYGKAHALFHAVRLGPSFIDIPVCQTLTSQYYMEDLLLLHQICYFYLFFSKLL